MSGGGISVLLFALVGVASLLVPSSRDVDQVRTEVVNSGHLVAYGKYFPPPYTVTLKCGPLLRGFPEYDSIFVNGILYRPSLQRPYLKCVPEGMAEMVREYSIIQESLHRFLGKYGFTWARIKANRFLRKQSHVSHTKKCDLSKTEWFIRLHYRCDAKICTTGMRMLLATEAGKWTRKAMCESERRSHIGDFEDIVRDLRFGRLVVFGYNRAGARVRGNPKDHLLKIKAIVENTVSDSLKKRLFLDDRLIRDRLLIEEILENEKEWQDLRFEDEK